MDHSNNHSEIAEKIATKFCEILHSWLSEKDIAEINRRNSTPEYVNCCATHDFCDANIVMIDAIYNALEKDQTKEEIPMDDLIRLSNAAWPIAKSNNFKIQ